MKRLLVFLVMFLTIPAMADSYLVTANNENWRSDLLIANGDNTSTLKLSNCISGAAYTMNLTPNQYRFVRDYAPQVPCASPIGVTKMNVTLTSGTPTIRIATYARFKDSQPPFGTTAFLIPALSPLILGTEYRIGPIMALPEIDTAVFIAHAAGDGYAIIELTVYDGFGDRVETFVKTVGPNSFVNFVIPRLDIPVGSIKVRHSVTTGGTEAQVVGFVSVGLNGGSQIVFPLSTEVATPTACIVSPCLP